MKIKSLVVLILIGIVLSGCSEKTDIQDDVTSGAVQDSVPSAENNVQYIDESADWIAYTNTDSLIEAANVVVLGKVTGISFQILDLKIGRPPLEDSELENCRLCTIYDVEVGSLYKGNADSKFQFFMYGGLKEEYLEEQFAALDSIDQKKIPVMEGTPDIDIDQTYLFILYQYEGAMPTPLNLKQGVYKIDDPLQKDAYSYVSPKEIISYFGEDKWTAFVSGEDTEK